MFELPKTLVNNIHFPKIKVALLSTLFVHHFYINTIHTLYVVFVYINCFSFHVCFNLLKFENSFGQISRSLNLGAKQVRNTKGVTTFPLKRILSQDSKQESKRENAITLRRSKIARKITRLQILNHTEIQRYMIKSNLVQPRLNPEVQLDEDNGETAR